LVFYGRVRQLRQLLSQQEENISLDAAALELATIEFPGLDPRPFVEILDSHARELGELAGPRASGRQFVEKANRYFFETLGFRGNSENYYDPRNSCLNEVLTARTGIPITLSAVYIEVARRLGRPVHGIEFPSHFLIQYRGEDYTEFIDCFHGGRKLTYEELRQMGLQVARVDIYANPGILRPATTWRILVRMLNNLRHIYVGSNQAPKALMVADLLVLAKPDEAENYRDRGVILGVMGRFQAALADFTRYLSMAPDAPDREAVEKRVTMIRKYLRSLN